MFQILAIAVLVFLGYALVVSFRDIRDVTAVVMSYVFAAPVVFPLFYGAARLRRRARRIEMHAAEQALAEDIRPTVLFLRSFDRDGAAAFGPKNVLSRLLTMGLDTTSALTTFEELLVNELYAAGPVVAVNEPGERNALPDIGARRVALSPSSWLQDVTRMCREAALIVLQLDETPGLKRELEVAADPSCRAKLLLLLPVIATPAQQRSYYPTYLYLAEKYPFLPLFDAALVAVDFEPGTLTPRAIRAPHELPDGLTRSLVVATWLQFEWKSRQVAAPDADPAASDRA